ncbi:MAG: hypothetical protein HY720_00145 [Planctomycetes bacterium]|nr:hypothetical protein [Planctomycetota bacterium]
MSETTSATEPELQCRRVERSYKIEEHLRCPYCFGKCDDIRSGDYERFCDFVPGVDPIAFGFPATHGRWQA